MKIYTKSGDKGETSLFGGERVKKNHLSIKAYGTIDELNSWIGLIKDKMGDKETDLLISVQEQLFTIGSYLATGNNKKMMIHLPPMNSDCTIKLEKSIDKIQFDFYFNFDQQKINFDNVKIDNNYIESLDRFINNFNSKGKILNKIMLKNFINDLFDIYAG